VISAAGVAPLAREVRVSFSIAPQGWANACAGNPKEWMFEVTAILRRGVGGERERQAYHWNPVPIIGARSRVLPPSA